MVRKESMLDLVDQASIVDGQPAFRSDRIQRLWKLHPHSTILVSVVCTRFFAGFAAEREHEGADHSAPYQRADQEHAVERLERLAFPVLRQRRYGGILRRDQCTWHVPEFGTSRRIYAV